MIITMLWSSAAFAQVTYTVDDFSPDYKATVYVEQPEEVFSPGWISIEDKKTKKELILLLLSLRLNLITINLDDSFIHLC